MEPYSDIIIETISKYLPKSEDEWELVGFINKEKESVSWGKEPHHEERS